MTKDAIDKYLSLMSEVMHRTREIERLRTELKAASDKTVTIESIYLQFRKILEAIAFGSLVANKTRYSAVYKKFAATWNAKELMCNLYKINSNFYPIPVEQHFPEGVDLELRNRKPDYLTKTELIDLYNKCGAVLHRNNPYSSSTDYAKYEKHVEEWASKLINLLDTHLVHLVGDPNIYAILMGPPNKEPGCLTVSNHTVVGVDDHPVGRK